MADPGQGRLSRAPSGQTGHHVVGLQPALQAFCRRHLAVVGRGSHLPHQLEDSAECRAVRPAFEPGAAATMGIGVFPSSPTDEWWTMLRADLADEETVEERHSSLLVDPA